MLKIGQHGWKMDQNWWKIGQNWWKMIEIDEKWSKLM
jgi:hypothetical protein